MEILEPSFERTDERGTFIEVLNRGRWEALICGQMRAKAVMGNHYHKKTEVCFFLRTGSARIDTIHVESGELRRFPLSAKQGIILRTKESHAIHFLEDSEFIMLKSLRYDPADPDTFSFPVPE
jgi:dTDP-4-dehydrorhamnose 3,5-epimerase-like enzyme